MRFLALAWITFKGGLRDRLFLAVFLLGMMVVLSIQFLAALSMRQAAQTALTYSLGATEVIGVLLTLFMGVNLLGREVADRTILAVLAQPITRSQYILGKFTGLLLLLTVLIGILGLCSAGGVWITYKLYPRFSDGVPWLKLANALFWIVLSLSLLGTVTIFFTSLATSSTLPFMMSCAVYTIGQGLEGAKEFVASPMGQTKYTPLMREFISVIYYIFPNFSLLDFKVQAIYDFTLSPAMLGANFLYWLSYTGILLVAAMGIFAKREIA
ncbi:ABC transporter permease subunit [Thiovibrio sp. JS02]